MFFISSNKVLSDYALNFYSGLFYYICIIGVNDKSYRLTTDIYLFVVFCYLYLKYLK